MEEAQKHCHMGEFREGGRGGLGEGVGHLVSYRRRSVFSKPLENIASSHAGRNRKDVDRHFTGVLKIL